MLFFQDFFPPNITSNKTVKTEINMYNNNKHSKLLSLQRESKWKKYTMLVQTMAMVKLAQCVSLAMMGNKTPMTKQHLYQY